MWLGLELTAIVMQVDSSYLKSDILADIQNAFQSFLSSGQAGAMMIGLVSGYVIRGITK